MALQAVKQRGHLFHNTVHLQTVFLPTLRQNTLMTFEYIPDESDFLNYLYYVTTKSKRIQKKRMINKFFILFLYLFMGLFLSSKQGPIASAVFFLLCLPMYFVYGYLERKQYFKHFTKYVKANYNDEVGVKTTIDTDDEGVSISVGENISRMEWSEIDSINETGTLILIQEKNQNAIVIPKQKTSHVEALTKELHRIADSHSIDYNEELNWKWK